MQRYLNFFHLLSPLTSNHGTTLPIKNHFIKSLFPESTRKLFFFVLCGRNILLFHLYCKVGSPENSFLNVACYGCILAPKGIRNRHTQENVFETKWQNFLTSISPKLHIFILRTLTKSYVNFKKYFHKLLKGNL